MIKNDKCEPYKFIIHLQIKLEIALFTKLVLALIKISISWAIFGGLWLYTNRMRTLINIQVKQWICWIPVIMVVHDIDASI